MDFGAGFPAATVSDFDNSHALWATEEDYQNWNGCPIPDPPPDSRPQYRSGSEPPTKKNRTPQGSSDSGNNSSSSNNNNNNNNNNRSKAIGKMFYKTKLCCKFRAGVCPYITNCNFAHGIEELRRPPPNWQEIVAANDEAEPPPREEHQIPTFSSSESRSESQRAYKGRHCKKFYTEEGCPYGESCTFLHDEQSRARESVAISLSPSVGGSGYGNGAGNGGQSQKPSNWKTRICNKWETTGSCPFGSKCHFAHGFLELHKYGGGPMEMEGRDSNVVVAESKHNGTPLKAMDTARTSATLAHHSDVYHMGAGLPSQRPSALSIQRTAQRPHWKGPDKISKIYGDWIDDIE